MDRSLLEAFGRRVRVGIVGGGTDSVIGRTHLIAMRALSLDRDRNERRIPLLIIMAMAVAEPF